jgi:hypothetical protein
LFWQQTPRINHCALMGAVARVKREWENGLHQARWIGFFAQVKVSEHGKLIKQMLDSKPDKVMMSGRAIGAAMRAWAARSK